MEAAHLSTLLVGRYFFMLLWPLAYQRSMNLTVDFFAAPHHNETPFMDSAVQFDTLGIKWRIYQDVGVKLLDFRGLQKSTGTGK